MATVTRIFPNTYRDSIALMQLSTALAERPGIEQASAIMATEGNLDLLREAGLLAQATSARPSDILLVVRGKDEKTIGAAIASFEQSLAGAKASSGASGPAVAEPPRSIAAAVAEAPGANLALISVPGEYAAAEARKALGLGLNVMLFSDNVAVEDEVALKRLADAQGLLLMGPDCGTAIVNGVPLGFANVVRAGSVGCIGASGTGLQQVTSLVDQMGAGISQAIGTGGRDLSEAVGGITMLAALKALATDRATEVIVLISKPPAEKVAKKVLAAAAKAKKPVVVCFVGAETRIRSEGTLWFAPTLESAATVAASLAVGKKPSTKIEPSGIEVELPFAPTQKFVRGLYSGGTFCYEASALLGRALGDVWSNASVRADRELADPWKSQGHTVVDLGDDAFTRGRPHPMIDHRLRNERIVQEAGDPSTAVLLLDVVLGHGAHPDPVTAMRPALDQAQAIAEKKGRTLPVVAFICGTAADPQDAGRQEDLLNDAGVMVAGSNAEAVELAAAIARAAAATRGTKAPAKKVAAKKVAAKKAPVNKSAGTPARKPARAPARGSKR